jgi:hypothetical protein
VAVGGEPEGAYLAETLEIEFRQVQPPDFFTSVKNVEWPDWGAFIGKDYSEVNPKLLEVEAQHSVWMWVAGESVGVSREENIAQFTNALQVRVAWVVKSPKEVRRQILLAMADLRHVMEGNSGRVRPGYTGPNTYTFTTQRAVIEIENVSPGLAIIWSIWPIEYGSPFPAG